ERDQIIYEKTGSARTWYGVDAVGSVRQTYNDAGQIVANRHYSAFGVEQNPTTTSGLGYAGEWRSPSGLTYLRARWYDPAQGRFLERDPWDGTVSQPQSLNV